MEESAARKRTAFCASYKWKPMYIHDVRSAMVDSMMATWLNILHRLEGGEEFGPLERHLLHEAMWSLAGDIDALFLEEAALLGPET
jgi:hypothetical protein